MIIVIITHHSCDLSASPVVDAGKDQRGEEEEEGTSPCVDQVLHTKHFKHVVISFPALNIVSNHAFVCE